VNDNLKSKISLVPTSPGIYFFRNNKNEIIYIGKAKSLRNRVRSYFSGINKKDAKTQVLVRKIKDVDWLVVRSEAEALLAEANLIKEHKPRYNVFLKDDKTFPYIRITNEDYPKIEIMRMKNLKKDIHTYFGPYTDTRYLRRVLKSIYQIFPQTNQTLKHLKINFNKGEGLSVSRDEYNDMIEKIKMFLKGRSLEVRTGIKNKMDEASSRLMYEEAARYRDQLSAIDNFLSKQKKVSHDFMDRDIISISAKGITAVAILLRVRNGHLVGKNKFLLNIVDDSDLSGNMRSFITQHYSSCMDFPKEILLDVKLSEIESLQSWLSEKKKSILRILSPQRGDKYSLVKMCQKNADLQLKEILAKKIKRREVVSKKVESLQSDLDMLAPPRRIEAFDNSNIQGMYPVAGMVCFVDGKPLKREYRKFNIKTVEGVDDFAMMHEVVLRKYKRTLSENTVLPDLILVDGGKGQLSYAKRALDSLGLGYIPIIGLAKKLEEVYKPGISTPQNIPKTSPGIFLLRQIRDEVHRFAISFHRSSRNKGMTQSVFDNIKGMGKVRIKRLWEEFDNLKEIRKASISEIEKKVQVTDEIASKIKDKANNII